MFQLIGDIHKHTNGAGKVRVGNFGGYTTSNVAKAIDTLWACPFIITSPGQLDKLAFEIQAGAAGAVCRVGLYHNKGRGNLYPDTLIVETGELSGVAAGVKEASIDVKIDAGIFWFVYIAGVLAPTARCVAAACALPLLGLKDDHTNQLGISKALAYAALPSTFPSGGVYVATELPRCTVSFSAK